MIQKEYEADREAFAQRVLDRLQADGTHAVTDTAHWDDLEHIAADAYDAGMSEGEALAKVYAEGFEAAE